MTARPRPLTRSALIVLPALALAATGSLRAQAESPPSSGFRAEILADIDALESKYMSLAEAMVDHFAWRPSEGVRSGREVFSHIAGATIFIPVAMGVSPPPGMEVESLDEGFQRMAELEQITDAQAVLELLQESFAHARTVVASVSEADFEDPVEIFGQTFTKRQGLLGLVTHMHEHLGQAVAYARMNGVIPPWSGG